MIDEFFSENKKKIVSVISEFLDKQKKDFSRVNNWGEDILPRIENFVCNGGIRRGSCVILSSGKDSKDAILLGAAVEMLHSFFLVHDDIMDNDRLRRGKPTIFAQYEKEHSEFTNPYHWGISMGILVGDIMNNMVFDMINSTSLSADKKQEILSAILKEVNYVILAQMDDMHLSFKKDNVSEKEVTGLYTYKTARYTFSLPFKIGSILASHSKELSEDLQKLGEKLGVIFQIKDDYLGIFGDEKETGKPVGSDIRENKKTLYYLYLYECANEDEKKKLNDIFGSGKINEKEIGFVRDMIRNKKIDSRVDEIVKKLAQESEEILKNIDLDEKSKKLLSELADYIIRRKR